MVNRTPEKLGDFVRRIRKEKSLSLRDVSKRSARFGKPITPSYISRIENDPTRRVTADRLNALAYGLGVSLDELLACAVGKIPADDADEFSFLFYAVSKSFNVQTVFVMFASMAGVQRIEL